MSFHSSVVINDIRLFNVGGITVMSYHCLTDGMEQYKNLVEIHNRLKKQIRKKKIKYRKARER